jgi:hypothetical protein
LSKAILWCVGKDMGMGMGFQTLLKSCSMDETGRWEHDLKKNLQMKVLWHVLSYLTGLIQAGFRAAFWQFRYYHKSHGLR